MPSWVLDASVVLACIRGEPGGDVAEASFSDSLIGTVNLCEVVTHLIDRGIPQADAFGLAKNAPYGVVEFDEDLALDTGALRAVTRHVGLSLGDRAWTSLDIGVEIRLIR